MGRGGKGLMGVALATLLGAGLAAALSGYLHSRLPATYQSVATLYMPANSDGEVALAPPPDNDLPPIDRYTGAALASLRMPDYATLSRSETVAERVAARLAVSAEASPGPYTAAQVRGAMHAEARPHWSGVYQVIYQRALELRVRWHDAATATTLAGIWAEEASAFLAEIEHSEEPPLVIASVPSEPGVPVGIPALRAIAASAFLGGLFSFLAALSSLWFLGPARGPRDA